MSVSVLPQCYTLALTSAKRSRLQFGSLNHASDNAKSTDPILFWSSRPPHRWFTRPLLSPTRSSQNQVRDLFGMRHQRQVTCIYLHGSRIHAFCQNSLQVGV